MLLVALSILIAFAVLVVGGLSLFFHTKGGGR
jgi:hypothetical protein